MVAFRSTVATRSIVLNGSVVSNTSAIASNIDLNSTGIQINPNDEGYNWDGDLALFYTYNRGLTNAELLQNYSALRNRFGI
jgi:hypothetical protein